MSIKNVKNVLENGVGNFVPGQANLQELAKYKQHIKDKDYFDFILASGNGGFFYGQSLHIYGYSPLHIYHNMDSINLLLQKEYGNIIVGLFSFSQDLFGNQFCFDTVNNRIVFFDIETGSRDIIATDFSKWADVLQERLQYFTGIKVLNEWFLKNRLEFNQRLCPKVPFLMGGEFKVDNLYASTFPDSIKAYANIARQVYNLPDGTPVKLNIGKKLF